MGQRQGQGDGDVGVDDAELAGGYRSNPRTRQRCSDDHLRLRHWPNRRSSDYDEYGEYIRLDEHRSPIDQHGNDRHDFTENPGTVLVVVPTIPTDSDGDGLSGAEEADIGTNPNLVDTDGDELRDGDEMDFGTSPVNPDTDGQRGSATAGSRSWHRSKRPEQQLTSYPTGPVPQGRSRHPRPPLGRTGPSSLG